jgi:hypothetical protein
MFFTTIHTLVLHVCRRNRDAALALLRRIVNLVKLPDLTTVLLCHHLRQRRRQRRLAVINVTYRAYVYVWFCSFKLLFRHESFLLNPSL